MNNNWFIPLMSDNILREDLDKLSSFINQDPIPQLTNGQKIREFEEKWSNWLGVKRSLVVNSGSSANIISLLALRELYEDGKNEIIVSPLGWVSDPSSIIHAGFTPIFCDINLTNFSFDLDKLEKIITPKTKAILVVSVLGINPYSERLFEICKKYNLLIIGDHCESHGTIYKNQKLGSLPEELMSNFSGYFAHHLTAIEMGIVSTNDENLYQYLRAFRSHSMVREMTDENLKKELQERNPEVSKDFAFLAPAYNFRSTELNGVLALSQLERLDSNNEKRRILFNHFIQNLDKNKYYTDFNTEGNCAYSFILILGNGNSRKWDKVSHALSDSKIEFRKGMSGGGNLLRQRFLRHIKWNPEDFKNIEYLHNNSCYIGLFPNLEIEKVNKLLKILNNINI